MPLAEGAATVPGGLPARLAHLQGPRVLGSGAGEPLEVDDPLGREIDFETVATNDDDVDERKRRDATSATSFPVAPGTPPTTARSNAQVLRAPGGSLLMGPWRGAFARADEPFFFAEREPRRSGESEKSQGEEKQNEDDLSARRATHLRDLGVDAEEAAEHLAELAFCGTDDMRLDEGRAVSLELVSEDAVAGRSSRRRNAFLFPPRDGKSRERVRSAPAAPTRKVGAQRVATRRRPSASFVRARREAARSKEGETKKGHGDVFVGKKKGFGFDSAPGASRGAGARGAAGGGRLMRPRASSSGGA